jgi:small GTP-binding protein
MMIDDRSVHYRVIVIGDCSVGKTSIISRLTDGSFDLGNSPTTMAAYCLYSSKVDGKPIFLEIWDTAGQERFRGLGPLYYRQADVGICVFSVTDHRTFDSLEDWIGPLIDTAGADTHVFIVGNKSDLRDQCNVNIEEAKLWSRDRRFHFGLTSALSGDGILELFQNIVKILNHADKPPKSFHVVLKEDPPEEKCCS